MMGKRVNFACRSVISPDPYIGACSARKLQWKLDAQKNFGPEAADQLPMASCILANSMWRLCSNWRDWRAALLCKAALVSRASHPVECCGAGSSGTHIVVLLVA
jgi:hypothetical protein